MQYLKLNDGKSMPILGLDTSQNISHDELKVLIHKAIDIGYRHFNCTNIYLNEKLIGEALSEKIKAGTIKRDDLFITSKLWNNNNTFYNPNLVEANLMTTLNDLGLDYLDLYLIDFPYGLKDEKNISLLNDSNLEHYVNMWQCTIRLQKIGLIRSIGVSNFDVNHIQKLIQTTRVTPVINHIDFVLNKQQYPITKAFCMDNGIHIIFYRSIETILTNVDTSYCKILREIAKAYNETVTNILLRYEICHY